ncbi:hypothetical protein B0H63DRAFT_468464 [Podospora didyma]|uniref:Uncharacterized protein n=1 Tax=Podospora didyma TaxID=330526 RepID=A0AAE0NSR1_9PEZI|nr:hypothetical protein B0H63DRAFT_468464 [Podospora didyma]
MPHEPNPESAAAPTNPPQPAAIDSPPQTSMFDDLTYYFTQHAHHLDTRLSQPCCTTLFPLKLIAAHFSTLHDFVAFQTATMRSRGWSLRRETADQIRAAHEVELAWSRFRCTEYIEVLARILDFLRVGYDDYLTHLPVNYYNTHHNGRARGCFDVTCQAVRCIRARQSVQHPSAEAIIPPEDSSSSCVSDWKSSAAAADFVLLHRQFLLRREDYDRITTSIAALAGIISGRVGIEEARTAKALTFVAMCFAPLSWVSSVYSIPDAESAGPLFRKYWASALPATLAVWLVFLAWQMSNGGMAGAKSGGEGIWGR